MDRLKGWEDLSSVRSNLLAHPFRDRNGEVAFAWDVFRNSKAPTTLWETLLLGYCVLMVWIGLSLVTQPSRPPPRAKSYSRIEAFPRRALRLRLNSSKSLPVFRRRFKALRVRGGGPRAV